jgi:hypothetical protein
MATTPLYMLTNWDKIRLFFINIINKTALGMHSDLLKATLRWVKVQHMKQTHKLKLFQVRLLPIFIK